SREGGVGALEMAWRVGTRTVRAEHAVHAERWHARIAYGGHTREQEGDFPGFAEVVFGSHVLHTVMLHRYALEPGAEHEFPSLVIGPPFFAAEPGRQRVVCTATALRATPAGDVRARRIEVSDPHGVVAAFAAWVDEHDVLLESYEDTRTEEPWMRLVEYRRGRATPASEGRRRPMGLVIRGGTGVNAGERFEADVKVEGRTIPGIGSDIRMSTGDTMVDAAGRYVLPGFIDPHVHMELPFMGTVSADDFETGTASGIAGGTTSIIDFCIP